MRNIRLVVEYDGTDFCGWQKQPNIRTVQGEMEEVLSNLLQQKVSLIASGRTDTGVHASAQVVNFSYTGQHSCQTIFNGGNALLPFDVRILSAENVPLDFNSRFSAQAREYKYRITKKPRAIGRQYAWFCPFKIKLSYMEKACPYLIGEQDFKSFCRTGADVTHYQCNMYQVKWNESDDDYIFTVRANRFLHNMVRILVGTFVDIGRGKRKSKDMFTILKSRDRHMAGPTVPAHGLILHRVIYNN
jgi:tRNA pseudouridine38-40 synthase